MATMMQSSEWLDFANRWVAVAGAGFRRRTYFEANNLKGRKFLGLAIGANPERSVDMVIVGPCSNYGQRHCHNGSRSADDFPIPTSSGGARGGSWLQHAIRKHRPQTVAVFPVCCGAYSREYELFLGQQFPDVDFVFLKVPNLQENPLEQYHLVVDAARQAGIVKVVSPATDLVS